MSIRNSQILVRIPVNVTADSGNVTGIPANVTDGSVLRVLILCRRAFPAGFLSPYSVSLEFAGPCQAAGGPPVMHVPMHDPPPAGRAAIHVYISAGLLSGFALTGVAFLRSDSPVSVKRW